MGQDATPTSVEGEVKYGNKIYCIVEPYLLIKALCCLENICRVLFEESAREKLKGENT